MDKTVRIIKKWWRECPLTDGGSFPDYKKITIWDLEDLIKKIQCVKSKEVVTK